MKFGFIFTLVLSLIFSCSKSKEKFITDNNSKISLDTIAIYDFINSIVLERNNSFNYCDTILDRKSFISENEDFEFLDGIKSELSKNDLKSIRIQYKLGNKFIYKQGRIKNKILISPESEEYNDINCLGSISVPLFNENKSLAIVNISHSCGLLCGQSLIIVYKKNKDGDWKEYKYLSIVIS
jgi:hypothetical protein